MRAPEVSVGIAPSMPDALPGRRVAIFDLDRTLLPGSSLTCFGRELVRRRLLPRTEMGRAIAQELVFTRRGSTDASATRLRARLLSLAAGRTYDELAEAIAAAATDAARRTYLEARRLIERHEAAGDVCIVLSASPHEMVTAVAAELGAAIGIGTRVEVVDGRLTGRLDGPFCYGPGKLTRLRDELGPIDLADATAYADSLSDLPVLQACGLAVATNPDRRLLGEARRAGWPVMRFTR